jgi:MFS family permease
LTVAGPPLLVTRADRTRLVLAALGVLIASSDTYVVVVALPNIMNGVGIGIDHLQRAAPIISGFLLGYTAVLPLIGRIADLAGTTTAFKWCLVAFAAGSAITATSHSLPVVVTGRAMQGVGGGGLIPVALAMVASRWPPDRRGVPLGTIGAVQELGSLLGPLYGAAVVAVSTWRTIFWLNLPIVAVIGAALWLTNRRDATGRTPLGPPGGACAAPTSGRARSPGVLSGERRRRDVPGVALALAGSAGLLIGLDAPASLADSVSFGRAYAPMASGPWAGFTTPVVIVSAGLLGLFGVWELVAPNGVARIIGARSANRVLARSDLPGALLLAGVLACVVVVFSTSNPESQVIASSTPIVAPLGVALAAGFWWRQRRAEHALISKGSFSARPAWGALAVNLWVGAALISALVDIPLFARSTVYPNSEVGASLVLVRFLVAVPVGAAAGGFACRSRRRAPYVAACGMLVCGAAFAAMATWSAGSLGGGVRPSDFELVACGFGFGLAIAPVNVAILGAVTEAYHALASALAVVARTVGMLVGLSALTAVALHRFYLAEARIPSPFVSCPRSPENCPAFNTATTNALLVELHTIFAGAAVCAAVAALLALWTLRSNRVPAAPTMGGSLPTARETP